MMLYYFINKLIRDEDERESLNTVAVYRLWCERCPQASKHAEDNLGIILRWIGDTLVKP